MVDSHLFHELDDTSLELRVLDPHEGLGERESVRRGEKVGHNGIWGLLADGIHHRFRIEKSAHVPTGTNARCSKRCARDQKDCPA
jgi:hypothetical protein